MHTIGDGAISTIISFGAFTLLRVHILGRGNVGKSVTDFKIYIFKFKREIARSTMAAKLFCIKLYFVKALRLELSYLFSFN